MHGGRPPRKRNEATMTPGIDRAAYRAMSAAELEDKIRYFNARYWDESDPAISDDDFDFITRLLAEKDPGNRLLDQVNAPAVASTENIRHERPMLSLDKVYSLPELVTWIEKTVRTADEKLLIQPKYDGISVLWEDGVLSTRGDGFTGKVITDKVPLIDLETLSGVLPLAEYPGRVLGELLIRTDDFRRRYATILNANGKPFKNSRNAIGGIMSLKDISGMTAQHAHLTLVDYATVSRPATAAEISRIWPDVLEEMERLPYPMDGLVIKLADTEYAESLGNTAHHPRGQIAFKFSGIRRTTRLLGVNWSFGKNCLTPVAELDPVEINGTTIRHATLHNLQNILDRDLQIGDEVTVERAGDVIPYIVSSEPGPVRRSALITHCPCCGHELVRDLPELRCVNPECFETRLQLLLASIRSIGIEHLGEPSLRKIMTKLNVRTLSDLFNLSELTIYSQLRDDGFQGTSSQNLYREIQSARTVPAYKVLAALNIKGIGANIAKTILKKHTFAELRTLSTEQLAEINGIGPERARALHDELIRQSGGLDELLANVTLVASKTEERPKICFTGKMPEKRAWYESIAKAAGYDPVDSVTDALALLVAADPNASSTKIADAKRLSVPIQSLDLWLGSVKNFVPKKEEPDKSDQMTFDF